jgi:hypothetical protein
MKDGLLLLILMIIITDMLGQLQGLGLNRLVTFYYTVMVVVIENG